MASTIHVRLTPHSARDEALGFEGDVLRARVTAPPVEGRANDALLRLLSRALGVPKGSLRIVRGQRSREKLVEIEGLDAAEIRRRLEPQAQGSKPQA